MTGSVPLEWSPHAATWMAWPRSVVWGRLTKAVRAEIERIAATISVYEPVRMLYDPIDCGALPKCSDVELIVGSYDDIWLRDTGPIFTYDTAVVGRFNGWGERVLEWRRDAEVGLQISRLAQRPVVQLDCVLEGGALDFGSSKILSTRSNLLDPQRNRHGEATLSSLLCDALGAPLILLDGVAEKADITTGHVDGLCRFLPDGSVLTFLPPNGPRRKRYLKQLDEIRHVFAGQRVIVHESTASEVDVQCHLNMYWINGAVVVPSCGDELDDERFADLLRSSAPGRKVEFVDVPELGSGGGWVHCATLHEPRQE